MNKLIDNKSIDSVRRIINCAVIFSLFLIVLSTCPVGAATYYVKNGGNDSLNGLSDSTAWATIAKVRATVRSGDIVYFDRQGTWSSASPVLDTTPGVTYDGITYTTSGSQVRAKLIATAYQDSYRQVVVRINGTSATTTTVKGFELDSNDLNLSGLAVGYGANASNVLVDNCVMHNAANSGWNYGMLVSYGSSVVSSVTVQNCEVYDFAQELVCLYPSSGGSVTNATIRNNTIHDGGTASAQRYGIGIILKNTSSNVIIEYNTLYNNNYAGIWVNPAANGTPVNATIRYNLIYNNHTGIGWQHSDGNNNNASANVYGNILYNNNDTTYNPAYYTTNMWLGAYDTINVYNNTIYETGSQGAGGAVYPLGGSGTINFRNNIIYTTNAVGVYDPGGYLTHSNNLIYRSSGTLVRSGSTNYTSANLSTWEATSRVTDPSFTGGTLPTGFSGTYGTNMVPNTTYFALGSASPAVDAGATLGSPYNGCINGAGLATPITRPQGAAYDIGAYEYAESGGVVPPPVVTPPVVTPPAAPKNLRVVE